MIQFFLVIVAIGFFGGAAYSMFTSKHPFREIMDGVGFIVILGGVLLMILSFAGVMTPMPGLGAVMFWPGVIAVVVGVVISRTASRKTCPQCAETVKLQAAKCRYCGHDFNVATV